MHKFLITLTCSLRILHSVASNVQLLLIPWKFRYYWTNITSVFSKVKSTQELFNTNFIPYSSDIWLNIFRKKVEKKENIYYQKKRERERERALIWPSAVSGHKHAVMHLYEHSDVKRSTALPLYLAHWSAILSIFQTTSLTRHVWQLIVHGQWYPVNSTSAIHGVSMGPLRLSPFRI